MAFLDAYLVHLLCAAGIFAALLGITAKVIAVRLLVELNRPAANDAVYSRSHRARPHRVAERPRLRLAS